jgi:hypothetical protein
VRDDYSDAYEHSANLSSILKNSDKQKITKTSPITRGVPQGKSDSKLEKGVKYSDLGQNDIDQYSSHKRKLSYKEMYESVKNKRLALDGIDNSPKIIENTSKGYKPASRSPNNSKNANYNEKGQYEMENPIAFNNIRQSSPQS